jgi:hypothetical protein
MNLNADRCRCCYIKAFFRASGHGENSGIDMTKLPGLSADLCTIVQI